MTALKTPYHGRVHWPGGSDPSSTRWFFVLPIAPATTSEKDTTAQFSADFESPWVGIAGVPPTAFRIGPSGKPEIRLGCTGGEDSAPSLIFTLPAEFRSEGFIFVDVPMGDDGLSRGTVKVDLDVGTVTFMGVSSIDGGSP